MRPRRGLTRPGGSTNGKDPETTHRQGRALGRCNNITPQRSECLVASTRAFQLVRKFQRQWRPRDSSLQVARAYAFCRRNDSSPRASVRGMQQHHAPEENGMPRSTRTCVDMDRRTKVEGIKIFTYREINYQGERSTTSTWKFDHWHEPASEYTSVTVTKAPSPPSDMFRRVLLSHNTVTFHWFQEAQSSRTPFQQLIVKQYDPLLENRSHE